MTITTTSLGTYTTQLSLSGELNGNNLITAIDTAIVAAGWTRWDVTTLTKVYRTLNKDGTTYKYIGIYIDPYNNKINTTCYESWNATTHVGTNPAFNYNCSGEMGYTLSNTDVIIMASPNWCILQTFIANQPSQWSGVVEMLREVPEDTSTPCFGWICSTFVLHNYSSTQTYGISLPRTATNLVGINAVGQQGTITPYVRTGYSTSGVNSSAFNSYTTYAWDTSKKIIMSLRPVIGLNEVHGRVIGIKGLYNAGSPFNIVNVPVDADFNLSSTGTTTPHWILGETAFTAALPFNSSASGSSSLAQTSTATLTGTGLAVVDTGVNYYILTTTNVQKLASTNATLATAATNVAAFSGGSDICFDGRYVYVTGTTNVVRYDTQNADASTSLTLTNGGSTLFYDGTFVWVGAAGSRINNMVYKVDPATFTVSSTVTLINSAAASVAGMCTNNAGTLIVTMNNSAGVSPAYSVVISTGTPTLFFSNNTVSASGISFDGTNYLFSFLNASNYTYSQILNQAGTSIMNRFTNLGTYTITNGKASGFKFGPYLIAGWQGAAQSGKPIGAQACTYGYGTSTTVPTADAPTLGNTNFVTSDGSKIYGCGTLGFFQYVNINHPDENSLVHGRLAIPK